ncbi:MAG TPA: hypothetical protein VGK67_28815 [Myxococcales bacterium]|jgi:hypothetical protein
MTRAKLIAAAALGLTLLSGCAVEVEHTQENVDLLLQAVLGRVQTEPQYLPDRGLLPADGPLLVREEIYDSAFKVTSASLPQPSTQLVTRAWVELQQVADASGQDLFFIEIGGLDLVGNEATLTIGVGFAIPESSQRAMLCCCSRTDSYTWQDGRWVFSKAINGQCS